MEASYLRSSSFSWHRVPSSKSTLASIIMQRQWTSDADYDKRTVKSWRTVMYFSCRPFQQQPRPCPLVVPLLTSLVRLFNVDSWLSSFIWNVYALSFFFNNDKKYHVLVIFHGTKSSLCAYVPLKLVSLTWHEHITISPIHHKRFECIMESLISHCVPYKIYKTDTKPYTTYIFCLCFNTSAMMLCSYLKCDPNSAWTSCLRQGWLIAALRFILLGVSNPWQRYCFELACSMWERCQWQNVV